MQNIATESQPFMLSTKFREKEIIDPVTYAFQAEPEQMLFTNYREGEEMELTVKIINTGTQAQRSFFFDLIFNFFHVMAPLIRRYL